MDNIGKLMEILAPEEAINHTNLPNVYIYKSSTHIEQIPLLYQQGIIIVGQGKKRVHLSDCSYEYNPDNYLVVNVPLPAECETFGSKEEPFLCMFLDIDTTVLRKIIAELDDELIKDLQNSKVQTKGLFVDKAAPELKENVARLLKVLQSPIESKLLGEGLVKELLYRVMCGESASLLYELANKDTHLSKISDALEEIHENYQNPVEVADLAEMVNMSTSAFHRTFKNVTSYSPIQYIKKVRLNNAKNYIADHKMRVNEAARQVGYESVSQFSREFKNYFGKSPKEFLAIA